MNRVATQPTSFCRILILVVLAAFGCRTARIGPPLVTSIPAGLSGADAEIAIVAMLIAPEVRREQDPNIKTVVLASPLGAILVDLYRNRKRSKGWFVESWEPGAIHLGYQRRSHYMTVLVETSDETVSLKLIDSRNLKQSKKRIHKNAKVWLGLLETDIRHALGHASLLKRDSGPQ